MKFRTRATTAYGYLTAIAKLVMEEPRRLNMGVVVLRGTGLQEYLTEDSRGVTLRKRQPSCGTVGCVAGWTLVLAGRTTENESNKGNMAEAQILLGLTNRQMQELFLPNNLVFAKGKQTKRHAVATVRHIQKFQKKHAAQLKSTIIAPQCDLGAAS